MTTFFLKILEWCSIIPSPKDKEVKLGAALPNMKTGDLIFSYNSTSAVGYGIRWFGKCPYSHVGMVIIINRKPYLFNATYNMQHLYVDPYDSSANRSGVILADLEQAVNQETRPGYFYAWKPLTMPLTERSIEKLMEFVKATRGRSYQLGLTDAMSAVFNKDLSNHDSNYFCSEMVGEAFKQCDIIESNNYRETFIIKDFYYQNEPGTYWRYHYDVCKILKL